ncbi:hypothetical protein BDR03DRAFT_958251, partial [Suillus americanus]
MHLKTWLLTCRVLQIHGTILSTISSGFSGIWCLKGLRSCLDILSEGQKLAKVIALLQFEPLTHSPMNGCHTRQRKLLPPFPSPRPNTTVFHVGTSRKRTSDEFPVNNNSALESDTSNSPSKRRKLIK